MTKHPLYTVTVCLAVAVGCASSDPVDTGGLPLEDTAAPDNTDQPTFMTGYLITTTSAGYVREQALSGTSLAAKDMDQRFAVTHTTLTEVGDCGDTCDWMLGDGSHDLEHDADFYASLGIPDQGAIFYDDEIWYKTTSDQGGHKVTFTYRYDAFGTFDQEGYWDW